MNIEPAGAPSEIIRPGDDRFEVTLRSFGIRILRDPNNNYSIFFRGPRGLYNIEHYILGITPLGFIESRRIFNNGNLGILRQNVPLNQYVHDPIPDGKRRKRKSHSKRRKSRSKRKKSRSKRRKSCSKRRKTRSKRRKSN